ncbi:MAG: phage major capsid protein, partial [Shewanella sp.]
MGEATKSVKGLTERRDALDAEHAQIVLDMAADGADIVALRAKSKSVADQINALGDTIAEAQMIEARAAGQAAAGNTNTTAQGGAQMYHSGTTPTADERAAQDRASFSVTAAIAAAANIGVAPSEANMRIMDAGAAERRSRPLEGGGAGIQLPSALMFGAEQRADMLATTNNTGGFTVQTTVQPLIPFLEPRLAVLQLGATYLGNQQDNLAFPRQNTLPVAQWAATEAAASAQTNPIFEQFTLSPKRLTAHIDVTRQNLLQSNTVNENWLRQQINAAVMRALEQACILGTGASGQPTGLLVQAGLNDIAIGANGGALDWANVVKFETLLSSANADISTLGYLFTPEVAGMLKTTKRDVAGNGFIWEGANSGQPSVNGYRAVASNFLPKNLTKGTSTGILHAALFGNWAELMIAQFGGIDIIVDPYSRATESIVRITV